MEHDEFIGRVQQQAHLSSMGDAERACRATLETLGEQEPETLVENIAIQLPREIAAHLRRTEQADAKGEFRRSDFIPRIAERAGVDDDQAACIARAVLDALAAATEGGLTAKVTESLPADLREYVGPTPEPDSWAYGKG
jgi:uncharacterized protein (DUF2267 family)